MLVMASFNYPATSFYAAISFLCPLSVIYSWCVASAQRLQHYFSNRYSFVFGFSFFLLSLDEFDAYIIVSFVNATLVLSIGETVEEVTDSGFLGTTPTLSCSLLGEDALVQVSKLYL